MTKLSETYRKMREGKGPETEDEWKDLALYLGSIAQFNLSVSHELDAMGQAMDLIERLLEIVADASSQETRDLMRKVVFDAYEGQGLHVSDMQGEDNGKGDEGPDEPGSGGVMSPEGEPV